MPLVGGEGETPTAEMDPAAVRAEEIAVAVTAIDHRDPQGFLNRLRPLASNGAYEQLRAAFVGLAWSTFERQELLITPEQVSATDQGRVGQGELWQARRVQVVVENPSPGQGVERNLIVQLVQQDGKWVLQDLLNEVQLAALMTMPTSAPSQTTATPLPFVQLPTPALGADQASFVGREFARAYAAVDYREQSIWLARMRALTTAEAYAFLRFVALPLLWPSAERMRLVIPYDEAFTEDLGVESQGETALEAWQVRLIGVAYRIAGSEDSVSDRFLVRVSRAIDADPDDAYGGWRASGIED